jgi:hypothetical protein
VELAAGVDGGSVELAAGVDGGSVELAAGDAGVAAANGGSISLRSGASASPLNSTVSVMFVRDRGGLGQG